MKDMILMPRELTAENGAKNLLLGEFFEKIEVPCSECGSEGNKGCEECGGYGTVMQKVQISWRTIMEIYSLAVEHLGKEQIT